MMNEIERIYQRRRRLLICAFICSILLFMVFTIFPILSWQLHLGWVLMLFKIAGFLVTCLIIVSIHTVCPVQDSNIKGSCFA